MNLPSTPQVPKFLVDLANQWFELNRKLQRHTDTAGLQRHADNIGQIIQEQILGHQDLSLIVEDPQGSRYNETRTDVECVGIAGENPDDLVVYEVIKPLIRLKSPMQSYIVQRAVIVAINRKEYIERLNTETTKKENAQSTAAAVPQNKKNQKDKADKQPKNSNNSKKAKPDSSGKEDSNKLAKLQQFLTEMGVNASKNEMKKILRMKPSK